jgi:nucleotide-binding universal stress UspA family protein
MYNKILVPLDGSPFCAQALPYVRMLGTALKCPVELLRIFEPEPVYYWPSIGNY